MNLPRKGIWWKLALGLTVTAVFLYLVLKEINWQQFSTAVSGADPGWLFLALLFLTADFSVRIFRWWWMLRALEPKIRLRSCGWPFLVSIAANNVLPLRIGDLIRVIGFREQLQLPAMKLLGTLLIERLLDLLMLLAFFFIGLNGIESNALPSLFVNTSLSVACIGIAMLLMLLLVPQRIQAIIHWIIHLSWFETSSWQQKLSGMNEQLFDALALLKRPRLSFELIALTIVAWTLEGAVFVSVALALDPQTELLAPFFALATGTLATLLPSSPGYIGTFDYFAMLGLTAYEALPETAAAFAIIIHIVLWAPLTLIGGCYFLLPGHKHGLWQKAQKPIQKNETEKND